MLKQDFLRLNLIKKGNRAAFEHLYKHYYASLCAYAELITKRSDLAEDIVQELFYTIWSNREKLEIKKSLKSYLFGAVHNNSVKYLNSLKVRDKYFEYAKYRINDHHEISDFDLREKLTQSIDKLPPQCKKVFVLSRYDKLKHAEIAEQLNISIKTVETQIRRANIFLREKLKEYDPLIILMAVMVFSLKLISIV
jgi:RNA polymerase sigma-70 factor (ECF subfamily)